MNKAAAKFSLSLSMIGTLFVFGFLGACLFAAGYQNYPALHTILDGCLFLLSGILALLLWDMGEHIDNPLPKHLAVSFAATCLFTLVHLLTSVDWSGSLLPIAEASDSLRPGTWPPSIYILPIGIGCSIWLMRRNVRQTGWFTFILLVLGAGMLALFNWLPRYTPPVALGITRPILILSPLLWLAVGWQCWRLRAADRKLPMLALMSAVLVISTTIMLYSRAPHDTQAIATHLIQFCGYLLLLLSLMQMAATDMRERIRAEQGLAKLNQGLERHVLDRTAQLRASEERYHALFEYAPDGIVIADSQSYYIDANRSICRMLGYTRDEMIGLHASDIVAPAEFEYIAQALSAINSKSDYHREWQFRRKDGSNVLAEVIATKMPDGNLMAMIRDITERNAAKHRIAYLNRVYAVLSGINTLIVRVRDRDELFREACRVAVEKGNFHMAWIGIVDPSVMKIVPIALAGGDEEFLTAIKDKLSLNESALLGNNLAAEAIREKKVVVLNNMKCDLKVGFGKQHAASGCLSMVILPLIILDEVVGVLTLCASEVEFFHREEMTLLTELAGDIAFAIHHLDRKEHIDYLAYYDELTGLANRRQFHSQLSNNLQARGGEQPLIATVLLDLERFRRVNETLGRDVGDDLLREIGSRLRRANDTVARIGIDMFGLIIRGVRSVAEVNQATEKIVKECFTEPFTLRDNEWHVACRAGIALYPDDGADADTLLRNAEAALRGSKRSGNRIVFYAPEMNARVAESLAIETRLRQAIERREFVLHYQPKVSLASGRIVGVEALIRWQDPDKGLIPPNNFIPMLEETGMILEVGRWVVEQAFADMHTWSVHGLNIPRVAVNVSASQLQNKDFVASMIKEIQRGGDLPEWLELEITESAVMRDVADSTRKLSILRGNGVTIAIDDFGTGYSSLAYLSRLPLDSLKIDQSFVSGLTGSGDTTAIVSTIIALGHGLKLKVVAEGVETEGQSNTLKLLHCDEAQGYLFGKPVSSEIFETRLMAPAPIF